MSAALQQHGEQLAASDERFEELLVQLRERWASLPVEADPTDVFGAFVRAAYDRGYTEALEERLQ